MTYISRIDLTVRLALPVLALVACHQDMPARMQPSHASSGDQCRSVLYGARLACAATKSSAPCAHEKASAVSASRDGARFASWCGRR